MFGVLELHPSPEGDAPRVPLCCHLQPLQSGFASGHHSVLLGNSSVTVMTPLKLFIGDQLLERSAGNLWRGYITLILEEFLFIHLFSLGGTGKLTGGVSLEPLAGHRLHLFLCRHGESCSLLIQGWMSASAPLRFRGWQRGRRVN